MYPHVECFDCHNNGNRLVQCPECKQTAGFSFSQIEKNAHKSVIPKNWILLDNESTGDVFHKWDLLEIIQTVGYRMYIHCNAGTQWADQRGDLPGYGGIA